jgi:chaperone modulatory protein CbpM
MIDRQQFLVRTRLESETLEVWIKEEWLIPRQDATSQEFSEVDIARTPHQRPEARFGRQR